MEKIQYKKYKIILADCPWRYNDKMSKHGWCEDHYQTMTVKDLCWLNVKNITDDDCALFMWATSPLLPEAIEVMKAWWFKYKTVAFVWSKMHKSGKDVSNLGKWTMGNVEICLLGVKGHPKRIKNNVRQLVREIRWEHSAKPTEVASRIVELMWDEQRLELFSRTPLVWWDALGNGVDWKDIREILC